MALGRLHTGSCFRRAFGKWLSQGFHKRPQEGSQEVAFSSWPKNGFPQGMASGGLPKKWLQEGFQGFRKRPQEGFPGSCVFQQIPRKWLPMFFPSGFKRASQEVCSVMFFNKLITSFFLSGSRLPRNQGAQKFSKGNGSLWRCLELKEGARSPRSQPVATRVPFFFEPLHSAKLGATSTFFYALGKG